MPCRYTELLIDQPMPPKSIKDDVGSMLVWRDLNHMAYISSFQRDVELAKVKMIVRAWLKKQKS